MSSAAPPPEGPGSPLVTSPSPIVAPATTVGYNGQALEVEITNPGEEAAIDKVTLEGPEVGEFFTNGSTCSNLAEGQKCSFFFGLKPATLGLKQATMVITFQGGRSAETFPVSGESVAPDLTFNPVSYDFGIQRINRETVSTGFQVTNTGQAPVQVNNLEIQGDNSVFWINNGNCFSGLLSPNQSCSLQVNFNPHDRVTYTAQLRAVVNDATFTAALSGQGGRAIVEADENPFNFGSATVGTEGAIRTITIGNSGDLPAGFFIAIVAGGDSGSFHLIDENCTGVELFPTKSCVAHVRFSPQTPGPKVARLALFGDGDDGTMVFLKGDGIPVPAAAAPIVSLAPSSFNFGARTKGTRSKAHSFAIRNDGGGKVEFGLAAIVGANLNQFQLTGDECAGVTLGAGEECLIRVRFTPSSAGAKTATLRVVSDAGAFTASLAGTGKKTKSSAAARVSSAIGLFSRAATR